MGVLINQSPTILGDSGPSCLRFRRAQPSGASWLCSVALAPESEARAGYGFVDSNMRLIETIRDY